MRLNPEELNDLKNNQPLSFTDALTLMKNKTKVKRLGWGDQFKYVEIQKPDEQSKMKRAYFVIIPRDEQRYPYEFTSQDILTKDWIIV